MEVMSTILQLKQFIYHKKEQKQTIGFVPTMGYLHEGHKSLMQKAKSECDIVILSIFVNPLQFGPNEDFEVYPRDINRDLQIAKDVNVDVVFSPSVEEMYPSEVYTKVSVSNLTSRLCGASRPGHFDGVSTVVMKLLNIVEPDKAYFGQKDAQQVAVIEQMVFDLNMNVEIVPCPIVREKDGLALSSRNVYLNDDERVQAIKLFEALDQSELWIDEKNVTIEELERHLYDHITSAPLAMIDYIEILSYPDLQPIEGNDSVSQLLAEKEIIIALAVKFGKTRLIDNRIYSNNTMNVKRQPDLGGIVYV
ncbi:pantoate--beta-alanine ligase [Chengkuizengella sediminis]|uniref:pantoate--beta-alanine ligase n=1 Tax=Chengkuizengella sediminis TaxID=1885917 RepID=UPI001389F15C|nr:pantoate--beta-alanine ligase [Chengkuizengella sediminis]NDI34389.1 pantoate--beta-alanine ligase [Chengkuizengella sediminis]